MSAERPTVSPEALRTFGAQVDFGKTAEDYATYRAGFPDVFFDGLITSGFVAAGQSALDLGTGTGTIARGLARRGLAVTGLDPAQALLVRAQALDEAAGVQVTYRVGTAEETGLPSGAFDLVLAGQCWHWFDRPRAAHEAARLLRPGGRLIIAHFDWVPLPGNVVAATEELILSHNPTWAGAGGTGLYPAWLADLSGAGFTALETRSLDLAQSYTQEAWRGRIRASAGIAASLDTAAVARFDAELAQLLARRFATTDPLQVPHRLWLATGRLNAPSGSTQ